MRFLQIFAVVSLICLSGCQPYDGLLIQNKSNKAIEISVTGHNGEVLENDPFKPDTEGLIPGYPAFWACDKDRFEFKSLRIKVSNRKEFRDIAFKDLSLLKHGKCRYSFAITNDFIGSMGLLK